MCRLFLARIKLAADSRAFSSALRTAGPHITYNTTLIYCGENLLMRKPFPSPSYSFGQEPWQ